MEKFQKGGGFGNIYIQISLTFALSTNALLMAKTI